MTLTDLIHLAVAISMALIVFALGLNASWRDAASLFTRPVVLARSLLSMNIIMLLLAVAAAAAFDLPPAIEIALGALALSPVPPILPMKQEKAGGSVSYTVGLVTAAALCSIIIVPALMALLGTIFEIENAPLMPRVASVVFTSVIIPLAIGMAFRHLAPAIAGRIARPLSLFATVLLVVACLPVLFNTWPMFWQLVGNGVLVSLLLFTLIGLAVGHFLGGPDPDDRTVLALATSTRHPGVALAIANLTFPDEKAVFAVVLSHLILGAIATIPYVRWRTRAHEEIRAP
ncbi:MAG: bile acid:sodium symporter family protein [Parvibaculaceae bacterium]